MKIILSFCLLVIFPLLLNSQTWSAFNESDAHMGDYRVAMATGYGGAKPYEHPVFYVRQSEKGELELFISEIGYTNCPNNTLEIIFDSDSRFVISVISSSDNSALFLEYFDRIDKGSSSGTGKLHFLEQLQASNEMSIQYRNSCTTARWLFKLDGSTKAINQVVDIEKEKQLEQEKFSVINEDMKVLQTWNDKVTFKNEVVKLSSELKMIIQQRTQEAAIVDEEIIEIYIEEKESIFGGHRLFQLYVNSEGKEVKLEFPYIVEADSTGVFDIKQL